MRREGTAATASSAEPAGDHEDISCMDALDMFQLNSTEDKRSNRAEVPSVEGFCKNPEVAQRGGPRTAANSVQLLQGIDVVDLYECSTKSAIWKDGEVVTCYVPPEVAGWEFYSLLWPQPESTAPLKLDKDIEMLVGRKPNSPVCTSMVFAYVPQHRVYLPDSDTSSNAMDRRNATGTNAGQRRRANFGTTTSGPKSRYGHRTARSCEEQCGNLDKSSRTTLGRLVVLFPYHVYKDAAGLPEEPYWGLFIGPRNHALVLLSKQRGRIDLHLAVLFALDAAFRYSAGLIAATSRLFQPFASQDSVASLFGSFEPLQAHCGLTNAVVADHADPEADGRVDYERFLGSRPPAFFVSVASCNLRYLTPREAQLKLTQDDLASLPSPESLPQFPCWTLKGRFDEADRGILLQYHQQYPVLAIHSGGLAEATSAGYGLFELFSASNPLAGSNPWSMVSAFGSCAEVTMSAAERVQTRIQTEGVPCSMYTDRTDEEGGSISSPVASVKTLQGTTASELSSFAPPRQEPQEQMRPAPKADNYVIIPPPSELLQMQMRARATAEDHASVPPPPNSSPGPSREVTLGFGQPEHPLGSTSFGQTPVPLARLRA